MKLKAFTVPVLMIMVVFSFMLGHSKATALSIEPQKSGGILYVKPGSIGNCSSWSDACELQTAIYNAVSGDQIWVAAGTYKPTTSNDRTKTFQLLTGVAIYGGFPASGGAWTDRDWVANLTTLSGDIAVQADKSDNSYHVVSGNGVDGTAILDGFTITLGNANGSAPDNNGGGLYNAGSSPTLRNLTFSSNSAIYGGGILNSGNSSPVFDHVTVSSNNADHGAGIYDDASSPTLNNVTFSNNTARINGGGMYNLNSSPTLTEVSFSGNKAEGTNQSTGGGMYNSGSSPNLTNVTFSGNTAYLFGDNGGGGMYNFESNPTLMYVTFSGNSASKGAGMSNKASSPTLLGGTFLDNSAYIEGGGMYNALGSAPSLTGVLFSGNRVYGYTSSSGGGMFNSNSNPTLTDVTFANNLARMDTSQNYCNGGGMFNDSSNPILTDVDFTNNSAGRGGGLYNSGSSPILTNISFTGNSSTGTNSGDGGGGMYNSGGSPIMYALSFESNTAVKYGGGMYNSGSSPSLRYIIFTDNSSVSGGGIYNNGGSSTLKNVAFTNNIANYGGGMVNIGNNMLLMNGIFTGNTGSYHGGGLYNFNSPTLTNVTFSSNVAAFGGGIFGADDTSSPTLTNVTFFGNSASYGTGAGGAIYNYSASTNITNGIFWGNTSDQIAPINPTITYSVIQGWTAGGTGNISTNPNLGPLADNGGFVDTHALSTGSVAIDTGSPTLCPVVDARGYARPIDGDGVPGARCDMGAFEYGSSLALFSLTVNLDGGGMVTKLPDKPSYEWGEEVFLTASNGPDWIFDGWSGDASGMANPLRVIITKNMNITASFWLDAFTLSTSVSPAGSGTVTRTPDQPTYHTGDQVTLTAVPTPGWSFTSWTGDASGNTNPLIVTMTTNKSITANFTLDEYALAVSINPEGKGSVTKLPSKPSYNYGDVVTLTASPTLPGWHFSGWSGDALGMTNPLTYTIVGNTNITANFSDVYPIYLPMVMRN